MNPPNGTYFHTTTSFESVAVLSCDAGFTSNVASVTCLETGDWDATPTCEKTGNKSFEVLFIYGQVWTFKIQHNISLDMKRYFKANP